jgi:hypothetical protein
VPVVPLEPLVLPSDPVVPPSVPASPVVVPASTHVAVNSQSSERFEQWTMASGANVTSEAQDKRRTSMVDSQESRRP